MENQNQTPTPNQTGESMSDTQTPSQSQAQPKEKSVKVTSTTTVKQLIELGLIKSSQLTSWNKRLNRVNEKKADEKAQTRAHGIVSQYIIATYKVGFENRFRVKPIEKALLSQGVSRRMIEKSMRTLIEEGKIKNNKGEVSNNCHVRHWVLETPIVKESPEVVETPEADGSAE